MAEIIDGDKIFASIEDVVFVLSPNGMKVNKDGVTMSISAEIMNELHKQVAAVTRKSRAENLDILNGLFGTELSGENYGAKKSIPNGN